MAKKDVAVYEGVFDKYEGMSSVYNGELMVDQDLVAEILNYPRYAGKKIRLTIEVLED